MKARLLSFIIEPAGRKAPVWIRVMWMLLLATLLCFGVMSWAAGFSRGSWESVWKYRDVFWKGWVLTIVISLLSLCLSTLIGIVAALARRSRILPLRSAALLYIDVVRGMPLLVLILFLYYVVANGMGLQDRLVAGILILSLFGGAYLAEMIRAGIESIPASQLESARAIGFTP